MIIASAEQVDAALGYADLVAHLRRAFVEGCEAPLRHHHTLQNPNGPDTILLLMPAWRPGGAAGVKIVSVAPGNADLDLPSVLGAYVLLDGVTGQVKAQIDGPRLTLRRTACASALAANYLARPDASDLLVVGAGALAPHRIGAFAAVRPIRNVTIWNRRPERAERLATRFDGNGLNVRATTDLETAARQADLISCATNATAPLIHGAWLKPGAHLDLIGAFTAEMRESDDEAVRRARIFVDTRDGALSEGGDIIQAIAGGAMAADDIQADLFDLCRGDHPGRGGDDEITLFKSVGTALEDLAAAELVVEKLTDGG